MHLCNTLLLSLSLASYDTSNLAVMLGIVPGSTPGGGYLSVHLRLFPIMQCDDQTTDNSLLERVWSLLHCVEGCGPENLVLLGGEQCRDFYMQHLQLETHFLGRTGVMSMNIRRLLNSG